MRQVDARSGINDRQRLLDGPRPRRQGLSEHLKEHQFCGGSAVLPRRLHSLH